MTNNGPLPKEEEAVEYLRKVYASGAFPELLKWWQERGDRDPELLTQRPVIRGAKKKKNTGICVDAEILERALEKAQKAKAQTGGSLSQLVELLLWQYIGSPEDVLQGESL